MGTLGEYVPGCWSLSSVLSTSIFIMKVNILIDQVGNPRLSDFGLLATSSEPANSKGSSSGIPIGAIRWTSPELFRPIWLVFEDFRRTKSSDCYALGMVIYETISGHSPFHKDSDLSVRTKVLEGERPLRESGFVDPLWEMLKSCWAPKPSDRPRVEDVLWCLEDVSSLPQQNPDDTSSWKNEDADKADKTANVINSGVFSSLSIP